MPGGMRDQMGEPFHRDGVAILNAGCDGFFKRHETCNHGKNSCGIKPTKQNKRGARALITLGIRVDGCDSWLSPKQHPQPSRQIDLHVEEHGFRIPLHVDIDPVFNSGRRFDTLGNQGVATIGGY